ncbi:hypothetical protein MNB_SM-6-688 [hydrothermal vent metagenome]|uniref:PpiC domain-containing protein n=1 Tax=hydrothermal vent metagenome TaxID=652676 RepID=A0A1W1BXG5_9ZZZZ
MQIFHKIAREPLVHFLIVGALLYAYFDLTHKNPALRQKEEITLLKYDLKQLSRQTGIKDKKVLFDYLKYQKSLLSDAYSLGLYKDDKTIQNILLHKMEFILNANAKIKEPTEEELKAYYTKHPKDFSQLEHFDLTIKEFDGNIDPKLIEKVRLFGNLNKADNLQKLKGVTLDDISKKFGKYLRLKIAAMPENYWSHPILLHKKIYLFYLSNKQTGSIKPFAEVEGKVYKQYLFTHNTIALRKAYKQLLSNYIIKVQ